ncbi:MAG: glycerol kinase GlpK [Devosiaceae bacterium]|nr:glycerol kinase GlpK [Devosiaceae bacterium]
MSANILAIDQGTTSTRAIIFNGNMRISGIGQEEFTQYFPKNGWVEHDANEIWASTVSTVKQALKNASLIASEIAAIGITNQRETIVLWDRKTGEPIHKAIVWQDRRTAKMCEALKAKGLEPLFTKKTGLLLDPYFSGTKIAFLLDEVEGLRERANNGEICFGTIDSWLIYKLTGGKVHATDITNASRTLLFNIEQKKWDNELLEILNIPKQILPEVKECADDFGICDKDLFGAAIPILGVAGDQHAATIGNACFEKGMMKATYGTGCFALLNTCAEIVPSKNRLLTTIAYQIDGKVNYALEGSIFIAGAAVQWLRDGLGIIKSASETGELAQKADSNSNLYFVPALTGLGAPHWDANARGAIFGITRNTGVNEFAKAALEAVAYQTNDLLEAMKKDWGVEAKTVLRVDGGMVASNWTMQFLSNILHAPVDRPTILETTALGAAWLAGYRAGVWTDMQGFAEQWKLDRRFEPEMDAQVRRQKIAGWQDAIERTLTS